MTTHTTRKPWMTATPLAVLLTAALGAGCIDQSDKRELQPLDTTTLGFTAASNLRSLASTLSAASGWLGDGELSGWLGDLTTSAVDTSTDLEEADDPRSLEDIADDLADRLEQDLLIEANVEESDGLTVVYLVPAERVCAEDDADCVRRFTDVPLRVQVTSYTAGDLDLTLMLGEPRLAPLTIELHHAAVTLALDVGEAFAAARLLGDQTDDPDDDLVVRAVGGALAVSLEARGPRHAKATFEVTRALTIDADLGHYPLALALGRSKTTLDLDADTQRATVAAAIGALTAHAPYQLLADLVSDDDDAPTVSGTLALDLAGFSASVTLDEAMDTLAVEDVGLGDHRSSLMLDGHTVVGVDLNASSGRKLDVSLTPGDDTHPAVVSLTPQLDLVVQLALRQLVALDADLATSWAADETLGVALDGAAHPSLAIDDEVQVTAGRLALSSRARPDLSVEVQAGQCLLAPDAQDSAPVPEPAHDDHPLAGFSAGACVR